MSATINRLASLIKTQLFLLGVYFVCRLLFYFFYLDYFSELSAVELIKILFVGIRFDVSAIIAINALFILLFLFPGTLNNKNWYKALLKYVFIITNSIALFANCADLAYFRYTLKRTTFDVFAFISTGNDVAQLLPAFVIDFWYVFCIWIVFIIILFRGYAKLSTVNAKSTSSTLKTTITELIVLTFVIGLSIVGFRGGLQLIPIYNVTAAEYTSAHNIPLVLNTPFSIIKTADQPQITELNYYTDIELKKMYSPKHKGKTGLFKPKNVVVLILESFSKEYIGFYNNGKGYTPFLDSLMNESLVFTNAFANGKKSSEGIPAVLASIPTLMNEPYASSIYGSNSINSLANLLKTEGYTSAFYHGGTNGTMNFKEFCSIAGFDNYYGRTEYNNEGDYDGHWGIWDEPYLQYFARQLNATQQPFITSLFTLSSHHPYKIPAAYKNTFEDKGASINKCVHYTDYSLKKFFEAACKMPWYNNTLFVITADHTGISYSDYYGNSMGIYTIPIIFFDPSENLKGIDAALTQQIDIMPSILDYLNYPKPYFAFGKTMFDSAQIRFNVNYLNNMFQFIDTTYLLQFDGKQTTALYNHRKDSLLKINVLPNNEIEKRKIENLLKAYIQTYNYCLMHNKMKIE